MILPSVDIPFTQSPNCIIEAVGALRADQTTLSSIPKDIG